MPPVKTSAASYSRLSDSNGRFELPPNPKRHAIIISGPPSVTWHLQLGTDDGGVKGVVMQGSNGYFILDAATYGTAIQSGILCFNSAGTAVVFGWIEFLVAE